MRLLAVVLIVPLAGRSFGDGVDVEIRLNKGQTLHYSTMTHHRGNSSTSVGNEKQSYDYQQEIKVDYEVQSADGDSYWIVQRLRSMGMRGECNGLKVDYDSSRGDPPVLMKDHPAYLLSRTLGHTTRYRIGRSGAILEIPDAEKLLSDALKDVPRLPVDAQFINQEGLTQGALALGIHRVFLPLPRWRLAQGRRWSCPTTVFSDMGFSLGVRQNYEMVGLAVRAGRPSVRIEFRMTPCFQYSGEKGPLDALKFDSNEDGSIEVDATTGVVVAANSKLHSGFSVVSGTGESRRTLEEENDSDEDIKLLGID